ncbi:hypothetical protein DUK53_05025 [Listeria sp. SHR_NRA_18]|uniref:AbrB/MazE/SpoVT family DNA-binding domain-containing protein n=1 Tax=Listeria TaxID=1637 RepID=UPI00051D72B4|nr:MULTISPECIES: hypothetical protein [Listeria]KGL42163.1 hypothetical protein EP56_10535 [Listeriaceae bacterium FSL A5-0209]KMT63302.1 hypothetical protein X559_0298 [Listeria newyorkensis]RQW67682.1 hypothetical protein DUK53_05025 [Listeria sp. SHR_NRA_18]
MAARTTKLKKWEDNYGVILPKETLKQAGLWDFEDVKFDVISRRNEIILKPRNSVNRLEKLFENYTGSHMSDSEIIRGSIGEELI